MRRVLLLQFDAFGFAENVDIVLGYFVFLPAAAAADRERFVSDEQLYVAVAVVLRLTAEQKHVVHVARRE